LNVLFSAVSFHGDMKYFSLFTELIGQATWLPRFEELTLKVVLNHSCAYVI